MACLVLLLLARPCQAYIDPGSGSLVLQFVMGIALGTLFIVRRRVAQAAAYIRRLFGKRDTGSTKDA